MYSDKRERIKKTNEYNKLNYDHFHLILPLGKKKEIKEVALSCGENTNSFIWKAIKRELEEGNK